MPALKGQRHEAFAQLAVRGAAEGLTQAQINATAREHGRRAECPKGLRPLFDIGVIAKSSMGSLARHPRCASLMLGMRVTKGHGRDHDYSIRVGVTEYGNRG